MSYHTHSISEEDAQKNLQIMNLVSFLINFRTYAAVMVIYFVSITESFSLAMTVLAVSNFSSSFFEIPTGMLSDRIGRKKTLLLCQFIDTTTIVVMYFANSTNDLFAVTAMMGLSMALRSGTNTAFVYENLQVLKQDTTFKKHEGRRSAYGRYSLVASALVGAALMYFYDVKVAIAVSGVMYAFAFLICFSLTDIKNSEPKERKKLSDAWGKFRNDVSLRNISIGNILTTGFGNVEHRLRSLLFGAIMPLWLINICDILNNLLSGFGMHKNDDIVDKVGIKASLVHFEILHRIFTALLVIWSTTVGAFVMAGISGIAFGVRKVASEHLLQNSYTNSQRATMGSINGFAGSLVYAVVSIGAGMLADTVGIVYTMIVFQVLLLVPVYFYNKGIVNVKIETKPIS